MQLRDAVEEAVRRWDALERSHGEASCDRLRLRTSGEKPRPFANRFAALDELTQLRIEPKHSINQY